MIACFVFVVTRHLMTMYVMGSSVRREYIARSLPETVLQQELADALPFSRSEKKRFCRIRRALRAERREFGALWLDREWPSPRYPALVDCFVAAPMTTRTSGEYGGDCTVSPSAPGAESTYLGVS